MRRPEPAPAPAPPASLNTFPLAPDTELIGAPRHTAVRGEETLLDVARRYDLGYDEIVAANPLLDPWTPDPGATVLLPGAHLLPDAPREGIVINLAARRLFHYPPPGPDGRRVVVTHPVGIGREGWGTPHGTLTVAARHVGPAWTVPASIRREHAAKGDPLPAVVPPGPDNPLGTHALRLSNPSYLIHGTNKPAGIGMRVSHGCIQMLPEDIVPLFDAVPVGTPVRIVNQPYLAGLGPDGLMFEAHAPLAEHAPADAAAAARAVIDAALARHPGVDLGVDPERVQEALAAHTGMPLPVGAQAPPMERYLAAAPPAPEYPDPPPIPAPAAHGEWYVDLGTFRFANNARRLAAMLRLQGPPIPVERSLADGLHAVRAGPFPSQAAARAAAARIERDLRVPSGAVMRRPHMPARQDDAAEPTADSRPAPGCRLTPCVGRRG